MNMSEGCKACKHASDLKGCASKHVNEALQLLSEGKVDEANQNLKGLETHLKDQ